MDKNIGDFNKIKDARYPKLVCEPTALRTSRLVVMHTGVDTLHVTDKSVLLLMSSWVQGFYNAENAKKYTILVFSRHFAKKYKILTKCKQYMCYQHFLLYRV